MKAEILAVIIIIACMAFASGYLFGMAAQVPQEVGSVTASDG